MRISLADLTPFQEICRKICLNIPDQYHWKEDAELVFFPLFKEFIHHWNFMSTPPEDASIIEWVNAKFGLMPGQVLFTSYPLRNLVLCVAWWPWGESQNVSMRVGLIPLKNARLREGVAYECLRRWLHITALVE